MSKELEALNVLYKIALNTNCHFQKKGKETDDYKERVEFHKNIIETGLKENEQLKTSYLENLLNEQSKEYIYKKLKALEIIKNKEIDTQYLIRLWKTGENSDIDILWKFNWYIRLEENKLTQEEYDLLKEVLL